MVIHDFRKRGGRCLRKECFCWYVVRSEPSVSSSPAGSLPMPKKERASSWPTVSCSLRASGLLAATGSSRYGSSLKLSRWRGGIADDCASRFACTEDWGGGGVPKWQTGVIVTLFVQREGVCKREFVCPVSAIHVRSETKQCLHLRYQPGCFVTPGSRIRIPWLKD